LETGILKKMMPVFDEICNFLYFKESGFMKFAHIVIKFFALFLVLGVVTPLSDPNSGLLSGAIAQTVEERKQEADRLIQLGLEQYGRSQFPEALQSWESALTIYQEIGSQVEAMNTLIGIGNIYLNLGNYPKAEESYQNSLKIAQEIGNTTGEGNARFSLGTIYGNLGDYPRALESFEQALLLARKIENPGMEGLALGNLGVVYQSIGEYAKAVELFQEALRLTQETGNQEGAANTLMGLGNVYLNESNYPEAVQYYQQSLLLAREIGNKPIEGNALVNLGAAYQKMGELLQAQEHYEQALSISREVGNPVGESLALNNLGEIQLNQGNYLKAQDFYQQSLEISRRIGNQAEAGLALNNLGKVHQNLGDYPQAEQYYQEALAIARQIGNKQGEGNALGNLGMVAVNQGNYPQAQEYYEQCLVIFEELGNQEAQGTTLLGLGNVELRLGEYLEAGVYYQKSLEIAREIGNKSGEGDTLLGLGNAYFYREDYSEAAEFYQQSLQIKQELGDRGGVSNSLLGLGVIAANLNDYPKSQELLAESLQIKRELGDQAGVANNLNNLGAVESYLSNYSEANKLLQEALIIYREIGDPAGETSVLHNLGNLYTKVEDYERANEYLFAAINLKESLRIGLTDQQKISFSEQYQPTYEILQKVLVIQNKPEMALEVSERGRARAFVELLAQRFPETVDSALNIPAPNLEQIRQIAAEQNATIVQYSQVQGNLYNLDIDRFWEESELYIWVIEPSGKVTFRRTDLKPLWQEQNSGVSELIATARCFGNWSCRRNITVARNSRGIPEVRTDRPREVNPPSTPPVTTGDRHFQKLHELLIQPIADLLPTDPTERVIFIPHDSLFLVPFPALQQPDGRYLIEQHTIVTAPSIQVLAFTRAASTDLERANHRLAAEEVLIVGNPLMPFFGGGGERLPPLLGAEEEAIAIGELLNVSPVIGEAATKSTVVQKMLGSRIIHLATHGSFDSENPLDGWLALTPEGTDNGLLTVAEIFGLNLNTELVVLSACDTGRGKITGDGVVGLSRAFVSAGTPSVLVSLWQVPDNSTAVLMQEFYRQLQEGEDKAQALRQAMLTTMEAFPNPIDWAGFTLMGEAE
jgi:CHAT domain-containing protein/Flp pilus assembly protein TadD